MKKYYDQVRLIAMSRTARDTYILFAGNTASAFWGFLFILITARALSVEDFGIFSAAVNLATILISVVDAGVSSGAINFVSEAIEEKDSQKADRYIKASIMVRTVAVSITSLLLILFSPVIAKSLLATNNYQISILTAVLCILIFPNGVFPYLFQARREFLRSVIVDNANFIFRLVAAYMLILSGMFKLPHAFWSFLPGFLITLVLSFRYLGFKFLKSKPSKTEYRSLLGFSGWVGVNRVISGISGRLDIQMLASITGAAATGLYSIPQRLAMFIPVLTGSYSSVLAPRMAGFSDIEIQKKYLIKSVLGIFPMIAGCLVVMFFGKEFVVLLFGEKYSDSAPIFKALVFSYIPFIVSVPAVTAIIYSLKKTAYIGLFSVFQLVAVFVLNLIFIPRLGSIGPTYTFTIVNTISAIYSWVIVGRYYLSKK